LVRRSWLSTASLGVIAVGVIAIFLPNVVSSLRHRDTIWTLPVHGVGKGRWNRVFDDAMTLASAQTFYVSSGEIVFAPGGHLKASDWSLEAAMENGQALTIQTDTAGLGKFVTWRNTPTPGPVQLGPTPAQFAAFLGSPALPQWCVAHPADEYMIQIQSYASNMVPQGARILMFASGKLAPAEHLNALPYVVSLVPMRQVSESHTATGSSVGYRGRPTYIEF